MKQKAKSEKRKSKPSTLTLKSRNKASKQSMTERVILGSPNKQKAFMHTLAQQYHGNMEGCDYDEFIKWGHLYCAASMILKAMKEEDEGEINF